MEKSEMVLKSILDYNIMIFCDKHVDLQRKKFCIDCKVLACSECFVTEHNGHRYCFVQESSKKMKESLLEEISGLSWCIAINENELAKMHSAQEGLLFRISFCKQKTQALITRRKRPIHDQLLVKLRGFTSERSQGSK
jgi:hypothetical protein